MDKVIYFEGTLTTSGKTRRKLIIYVPVEYHHKLEQHLGKKLHIIAITE